MSELLINDIKSNNSELKSYNEGMQIIEEMAEVLKNYTERNYIMASHVILECYAEELYSKNYRKQSEGEWYVNYMMSKKPSKRGRIIQYTTYTCSVCGKPNGRKKSKFCPNCGAKMKGGAE